MKEEWDVVIIGAGIVGAACAATCSARGMRTAIVEAGVIGGGATAAGMGHIVVMDDSPAQLALTAYSQAALAGAAPAACLRVWSMNSAEHLWVASDEDEIAGGSSQTGLV